MTLTLGSRLGPYEIVAPLGAGGMGEVFRGRDTSLNRDVAIKVLPAAMATDPERLARFRREAQVLASLNHPNLAAIFGMEVGAPLVGALGEEHERAGTRPAPAGPLVALVMELVEGEDLSQRLKRGAVPVDEAIAIARQIAEGLEDAHEHGIVHRDLKPANVKVTPDGKVKVLDFGLAKALENTSGATSGSIDLSHSPTLSRHSTEAGMIMGTAAYMSPEQARGKPVDRRADIWAFGVVFFEMLTGERLFAGETVSDTLAAVLRQEVNCEQLPKDLKAEVRRLIERCLDRDPRQRLRDIGEARLALSGGWKTIATSTTTTPNTLSRRALLTLTGAAAGGLVAGLVIGPRLQGGATNGAGSSGEAMKFVGLTNSGNVISASISPDGKFLAYVESEQGMQSLWLQQLATGQTLRLIPEQRAAFWSHTFTPDGSAIVYGLRSQQDGDGSFFSISTLGGAPKRLLGGIDSPPSYSPDGKRMTYLRARHPTQEESSLMVANADGSDPKPLATFKDPEAVAGMFYGAPAWSPDGAAIVTAVERRGTQTAQKRAWLCRVAVGTGAVSPLADPGWEVAAQAAFLPDGGSLLVIARSGDQSTDQIWSVSFPGGATTRVTSDLSDHRIISLTADGRTLISILGALASKVYIMPVRGGSPRRLSRAQLDGARGVTFTPSGKVMYVSWGGRQEELWLADANGAERSPLQSLQGEESVLLFPTVAADGTVFHQVRTNAGTHVVTVSADGVRKLIVEEVEEGPIQVTPDGSLLVYTALSGGSLRAMIVNLKTGERRPLRDQSVSANPSIDVTGTRVAFYTIDPKSGFRLNVASIQDGRSILDVSADPTTASSRLILGKTGVYLNTMPGDRANIWFQPLDGGPARRVTAFDNDIMFDFALSPDEVTLALARGQRTRDAQMITGFESAVARGRG